MARERVGRRRVESREKNREMVYVKGEKGRSDRKGRA